MHVCMMLLLLSAKPPQVPLPPDVPPIPASIAPLPKADLPKKCPSGTCKNCDCVVGHDCGCLKLKRFVRDGQQYEVVTLYTRDDCPLCPKAKEFFARHKLDFIEVNDPTRAVPAIEFEGRRYEGFSEDGWLEHLGLKPKAVVMQADTSRFSPPCATCRRGR